MADKQKKSSIDGGAGQPPIAADYYKLNTKAVEELATADVSNTPKYSEEELNRYRSHRERRIATWVKLVFVKFWFPGMVCFFFLWGLGSYLGALVDQLFVVGLALGIVTDLLTNNVIRFFAKTPGENDRWMMVPRKSYGSLFLNILYAFLVLFFVYSVYQMINADVATLTGVTDRVVLGVEPILFGLFYLGFDELLLFFKRLFGRIVADAKRAAGQRTE